MRNLYIQIFSEKLGLDASIKKTFHNRKASCEKFNTFAIDRCYWDIKALRNILVKHVSDSINIF